MTLSPSTRLGLKRGGQVCNFDEIYLEQDFFYLCHGGAGAHADGGVWPEVALHKIPLPAEVERTEYLVERRGVWKIRIAETSSNLSGMSKGEQRSELLMDKARKSLQRSDANRKGKRSYQAHLKTMGSGDHPYAPDRVGRDLRLQPVPL